MSDEDRVFVTVGGTLADVNYTVHLNKPQVPNDCFVIYANVTFNDAKTPPKGYVLLVTDILGPTDACVACAGFLTRLGGVAEVSFPNFIYVP